MSAKKQKVVVYVLKILISLLINRPFYYSFRFFQVVCFLLRIHAVAMSMVLFNFTYDKHCVIWTHMHVLKCCLLQFICHGAGIADVVGEITAFRPNGP